MAVRRGRFSGGKGGRGGVAGQIPQKKTRGTKKYELEECFEQGVRLEEDYSNGEKGEN